MQATTLPATDRTIHDQRSDCNQIAKFEQFGRDLEVPVKLLNFRMQIPKSRGCSLQALVGPDNSDVVPHQTANFVPVVINDDELIQVLNVPGAPLGKIELDPRLAMAGRFYEGPMSEHESFEERIAGETVGAMKAGASHFADRIKSAQGGLAVEIGLYAAALIVSGRDDGNRLRGNIDTEPEAGLVNRREIATSRTAPVCA